MCVILSDNIFQDDVLGMVVAYERFLRSGCNAMVCLKKVDNPSRFGVVRFGPTGAVEEIVEKPSSPPSDMAVTGVYFYDSSVFEIVGTLEPSARGELEITDVNNEYVRRGQMGCYQMRGWWTDAGTHASYANANRLIESNHGQD